MTLAPASFLRLALAYFCAATLLTASCGRTGAGSDADDRLDRLFRDYILQENIPGVSLVVMKGDAVIRRQGFGVASPTDRVPMPTDRPQPIYSVSKQFTAVLILRLAERSLVDLDAPVGRYLADFEDEPELTIRSLLRHTSGLPDFIALPEILATDYAPRGTGSLAETVAIIDRQPRRFVPGARFSYSNSNYTMLARIAEIVTGLSFDEAIDTMVLEPAGIEGIGACDRIDPATLVPGHDAAGGVWSLPPNLIPNYSGNGGLCASADALALWTRALGAGRILSADQMRDMLAAAPVTSGYAPPYGFGVSVKPITGHAAISHSGGGDGWGAWAAYLADHDITVVILANRGWFWPTDLGVPAVRMLTGTPFLASMERLRLTDAERARLTGDFEDGLFEISIVAEADRLVLNNPAFGDPIEFWKQPDGIFLARERPDTFALRLIDDRVELDWIETRSYFERLSK